MRLEMWVGLALFCSGGVRSVIIICTATERFKLAKPRAQSRFSDETNPAMMNFRNTYIFPEPTLTTAVMSKLILARTVTPLQSSQVPHAKFCKVITVRTSSSALSSLIFWCGRRTVSYDCASISHTERPHA
ncbi:hypothetical protein BDN67DRAFT_975138 [Paxillus ammoniavirescens]|nr:hypothetical protein BDN67DRAFT_975138 [Paxillus ammoniavirescens]